MNPQINALVAQGILKTGPLRARSPRDLNAIRAALGARPAAPR